MIAELWDECKQPAHLKNRFTINQIPTADLMATYRAYRDKEESDKKERQAKGAIPRDGVIAKEVFKCENADDCVGILHDARFLRLPCAAQEKWYHRVALARTPTVITGMPLEAVGVTGQVSPRVIELLHDRTKAVKLSDFYAGDLDPGSGKKDSEDTEWDTVAGIYRAKKAVGYFLSCNQQLWPMDTTGTSMINLLNKYHYCSMIKNVAKRQRAIVQFFNEVSEKNAHRATNRLPPLSFADQETVLRDKIACAGVVPIVPIECEETPIEVALQQPQVSAQSSGQFLQRGGRGGGRGDRGGRGGRGAGRGRGRGRGRGGGD